MTASQSRLWDDDFLRPHVVTIDQTEDVNTGCHSRYRDTPRVSANRNQNAPRHVHDLHRSLAVDDDVAIVEVSKGRFICRRAVCGLSVFAKVLSVRLVSV